MKWAPRTLRSATLGVAPAVVVPAVRPLSARVVGAVVVVVAVIAAGTIATVVAIENEPARTTEGQVHDTATHPRGLFAVTGEPPRTFHLRASQHATHIAANLILHQHEAVVDVAEIRRTFSARGRVRDAIRDDAGCRGLLRPRLDRPAERQNIVFGRSFGDFPIHVVAREHGPVPFAVLVAPPGLGGVVGQSLGPWHVLRDILVAQIVGGVGVRRSRSHDEQSDDGGQNG